MCLLNVCGWILDIIQRLCTCVASVCIGSAVCAMLVVAAMGGIALGYNYSFSEYIELKETNVSVYLKRGLFEEDIDEIMTGRRSVGGEVNAVGPDEIPDGRRSLDGAGVAGVAGVAGGAGGAGGADVPGVDGSVIHSGDGGRFEGGLARLTLQPPLPLPTAPTQSPVQNDADFMSRRFGDGGVSELDQLKAEQTLLAAQARPRLTTIMTNTLPHDSRYGLPLKSRRRLGEGGEGGERTLPEYDPRARWTAGRVQSLPPPTPPGLPHRLVLMPDYGRALPPGYTTRSPPALQPNLDSYWEEKGAPFRRKRTINLKYKDSTGGEHNAWNAEDKVNEASLDTPATSETARESHNPYFEENGGQVRIKRHLKNNETQEHGSVEKENLATSTEKSTVTTNSWKGNKFSEYSFRDKLYKKILSY